MKKIGTPIMKVKKKNQPQLDFKKKLTKDATDVMILIVKKPVVQNQVGTVHLVDLIEIVIIVEKEVIRMKIAGS